MHLAFVISDQTGAVNRALDALAQAMLIRGVKVIGTTQTDTPRPKTSRCDMDVHLLPGGEIIRISQDRGPNSRGCRLDPDALERAVAGTMSRLPGAEVLIVNKFGKHEAEGRGFREVIAAAIAQGVPVIVGTNGLNLAAFQTFSAGAAQALPADATALLDWVTAARATLA